MLPFFARFEGRRPQARELVLLAVMTAFAVAGRVAFYWAPQFKPVCAIVILTAVAFNAEAGFITGAAAGLISNMFFGQGPWTPWQMFGFGLVGFFCRNFVPRQGSENGSDADIRLLLGAHYLRCFARHRIAFYVLAGDELEGAACNVCLRIYVQSYPCIGNRCVPAFAAKARAFQTQAH